MAVERAVPGEMPGERYWINLPLPVRGLLRAEGLPRALVHVLPVEEGDNPGGHRGLLHE